MQLHNVRLKIVHCSFLEHMNSHLWLQAVRNENNDKNNTTEVTQLYSMNRKETD